MNPNKPVPYFYEFTWKIINGDKYTGHYIHYDNLSDAIEAWHDHASNPSDDRLDYVTIEVIKEG